MRETKFRAWDNQTKKFEYWNSKENKYDGIFWEMIKRPEFEEPQEYTGLKDKNGKEIYEGDIVKYEHTPGNIVIEDMMDMMKSGINYSEVIGNIYENKELLEEKK